MIETLDTWLNTSTNFTLFAGTTTAIMLISLAVIFYACRKIGRIDERTSIVYLRASNTILISLLVLLAIFISWVDADTVYFRQLLIAVVTIAIGSGATAMLAAVRKNK